LSYHQVLLLFVVVLVLIIKGRQGGKQGWHIMPIAHLLISPP
jgi:hypothetical protein